MTTSLAKAVRMTALPADEAFAALQIFRAQWLDFVRLQITESLVARADTVAWEYGLRGFDAMHLAAALLWQEALGERVTVATFDRRLWEGGRRAGLESWPSGLS